MRTLDEIRKKVKWIKPLFGDTYGADIETKHWRGSVVFGFNEGG